MFSSSDGSPQAPAPLPTLIDIVAGCLDTPRDKIHPGSRLYADLGADSLDLVDILRQIEVRLNVPMDGPERTFLGALASIPPRALAGEDAVRTEWLEPWRQVFPGLDAAISGETVHRAVLKDLITVGALAELVQARLAARTSLAG